MRIRIAGLAATLTVLINFTIANGAYPFADLIADANGDLFGTTSGGGTNRNGSDDGSPLRATRTERS